MKEYDSIQEVYELVQEGKKIMKSLSAREREAYKDWQQKLETDLKTMLNELN